MISHHASKSEKEPTMGTVFFLCPCLPYILPISPLSLLIRFFFFLLDRILRIYFWCEFLHTYSQSPVDICKLHSESWQMSPEHRNVKIILDRLFRQSRRPISTWLRPESVYQHSHVTRTFLNVSFWPDIWVICLCHFTLWSSRQL